MVGILGCKKVQNRPNGHKLPMKQSIPDVFLTILMELDPPNILPCIVHIMRMIFAFYSVSLELPGPRYDVTKAQNSIVIVIVGTDRSRRYIRLNLKILFQTRDFCSEQNPKLSPVSAG